MLIITFFYLHQEGHHFIGTCLYITLFVSFLLVSECYRLENSVSI